MAEVVGTVAAVLELTKTTASTALQVYEFFSVIHDAPREINTLSQDVHAFYSLVQNLAVSLETISVRSVVENDEEVESSLKTLVKPMGNCCTALRRMKDKLGPYVKSEVSWQESGSSQPTSIERLWMKSGGNITWFFSVQVGSRVCYGAGTYESDFRRCNGECHVVSCRGFPIQLQSTAHSFVGS